MDLKIIIDKNTGQVICASTVDMELPENEIFITEQLTVSMVKPYFNQDTREFYETATEQEIIDFNNQNI